MKYDRERNIPYIGGGLKRDRWKGKNIIDECPTLEHCFG
jgi:hypothetical protein